MSEQRMHPTMTLALILAGCLMTWTLLWTVIYAIAPGPASEACHAEPTIERSNAPHV